MPNEENFANKIFTIHQQCGRGIPKAATCNFCDQLLELMFPPLSGFRFSSVHEVEVHLELLRLELTKILGSLGEHLQSTSVQTANAFMESLTWIYGYLQQDAEAIVSGDPAAQSVDEVVSTYPGFRAVAIYRLAHELYKLQVPLLPRVLSEYAHARTGIDIHPGARIGTHFCIDHGTGVVIGETTLIGNHVKLYQGVTLGALSVDKAMANMKRHPTIENNVIIYAGATILGGNTVIGSNSIIGGNVWLTESVPSYSRVYHRPQIKVNRTEDTSSSINFSI